MRHVHFSKQMTICISKPMRDYIKSIADKKGVSMNIVVNAMLDYATAETSQATLDKYVKRTVDYVSDKFKIEDWLDE